MAALATVLMLAAYFPFITYAVPCMASLAVMAVVIELNKKAALLTYIASILPVFLFCETESKILYIVFTGFYPIIKALLESIPLKPVEYLLKFLCFNLSVTAVYFISTLLFGISFEDLGELGKYGGIIFIALANFAFIAYDFCVSRMSQFYMIFIHRHIKKMLK